MGSSKLILVTTYMSMQSCSFAIVMLTNAIDNAYIWWPFHQPQSLEEVLSSTYKKVKNTTIINSFEHPQVFVSLIEKKARKR